METNFVVVLGVAVRRRLVAQPGGLTLGFALHLVLVRPGGKISGCIVLIMNIFRFSVYMI